MMTIEQERINELVKNGMVKKEVTVLSYTVDEFDTNFELKFQLCDTLPNLMPDKDGNRVKREVRMAVVTETNIMHVVKNSELAVFAKQFRMAPQAFVEVFEGAKLTILVEEAKKGESYKNPFSENATEKPLKRDHIFHHIVGIELSDSGTDALNFIKGVRRQKMRELLGGMFGLTNDHKTKSVSIEDVMSL